MKIKEIFLNMHGVIEKCDFVKEQKDALSDYANIFSDNEKLIMLAEKYYKIIFESNGVTFNVNKIEEEEVDNEFGMLFAMIYLARYELLTTVLEEKGIPVENAQAALIVYKDLFRRNYNCYDCYGFSGIYRSAMIKYLIPKTFRIGRLAFEIGAFSGPYTVYQNKITGETVALVNPELKYLPNGKQAPKNCESDYFVTQLSENEECINGYTVHNDGRLNFEPLTIKKKDYEVALKKGDPVLSVHIPGNDKMTTERVEQSFNDAIKFFETYYKDVEFKAFVCSSWLLDTGLRKFLKEESNILKFQQKFKIVLSFVNTFALYWNIFSTEKFVPYAELVPSNSFQKNVLEALNNGENLYSGNGYILYKDLKSVL